MCETLQRKVKKERDDSSVSLETDIGKWNEMEDTMNIAIDIDDTLTESVDYFLPYVAEYFGADKEELRKQNISYSNLPKEWKKNEIDFCKAYYDRIVPNTPFNKIQHGR